MNQDLRRLVNTVRRLQHDMTQRGFTAIGVRLSEDGDEIINDPKGMVLTMRENAKAFALRMLGEPVKE